MDILEMLQNDMDEICEEDIAMIQEELAIGDYSDDYKQQCRIHILNITHYFEEKKQQKAYTGSKVFAKNIVKTEEQVKASAVELAPEEEKPKTRLEEFREILEKMRHMSEPIKRFNDYILQTEFVTEEFIDHNLAEFNDREREELLRNRQFSEAFLDKYFDVLDHGCIAINQLFSEEFFIKHYSELPSRVVLMKSKNPWRSKDKRSKKLATFLRIKGVKI